MRGEIMPRVFISHSTHDRGFVERELIPLLEKHCIHTWYSSDSIQTADQWERSILEGLKSCEWFLVVLSPRSAASEWVKDELNWAMEHRFKRIIPLLLEDCAFEDFHLRLRRIQSVDFRRREELALRRLLGVFGMSADAAVTGIASPPGEDQLPRLASQSEPAHSEAAHCFAPATPAMQDFVNLLIESKLFDRKALGKLFRDWRDQVPGAEDVDRFGDWLVAGNWLTDFQRQLLKRGGAQHLFLGKYKLLDRVGKDQRAGVYKAAHQSGQVVAVKILPPSKAKHQETLARFQREGRIAQRLKHPNVIRTFEIAEQAGLHYLVMEYLEGETLQNVLERVKILSTGHATRLLYQALLGLQHIHEQGLVHRDLNPASLIVVPRKGAGDDVLAGATLKIVDIGLGKALFDTGASLPGFSSEGGSSIYDLTTEGSVLGTPAYMAPEQARNARQADIRADIYSLGCVFFHMLMGKSPFEDKDVVRQIVRHATEPPKPLKDFKVARADELQPILDRMLAKDPVRRYPTPERAAKDLDPFI
jgi:hypothetical protein